MRSELAAATSEFDSKTLAAGESSLNAQWLLPKQDAEWDSFVTRHPQGLVYHLSAWNRVLRDAFPHIHGQFLVLRKNADGQFQAGLPVYTVKSWLLGKRIVSVPFASFCDPLISSAAELDMLLQEVQGLLKRSKARQIEIRTTNSTLLSASPLTAGSGYKHHYLSLEKDREALFQSFAKSSVRQKIGQATNAGVLAEAREDESSLKVCHHILAETRRRHALPVLPYSFFHAMGRWLRPGHLKVFIASHAGKPVAFHLILAFKDLWISEYSGNAEAAPVGTNQLLYWETIKQAHAAGAKTFSFGRTSNTNEGLLAYKRRWATVERDVFDFTLTANGEPQAQTESSQPRELSPSYQFVRMLLSKAPLPIYRMIGNYCYRHLG